MYSPIHLKFWIRSEGSIHFAYLVVCLEKRTRWIENWQTVQDNFLVIIDQELVHINGPQVFVIARAFLGQAKRARYVFQQENLQDAVEYALSMI